MRQVARAPSIGSGRVVDRDQLHGDRDGAPVVPGRVDVGGMTAPGRGLGVEQRPMAGRRRHAISAGAGGADPDRNYHPCSLGRREVARRGTVTPLALERLADCRVIAAVPRRSWCRPGGGRRRTRGEQRLMLEQPLSKMIVIISTRLSITSSSIVPTPRPRGPFGVISPYRLGEEWSARPLSRALPSACATTARAAGRQGRRAIRISAKKSRRPAARRTGAATPDAPPPTDDALLADQGHLRRWAYSAPAEVSAAASTSSSAANWRVLAADPAKALFMPGPVLAAASASHRRSEAERRSSACGRAKAAVSSRMSRRQDRGAAQPPAAVLASSMASMPSDDDHAGGSAVMIAATATGGARRPAGRTAAMAMASNMRTRGCSTPRPQLIDDQPRQRLTTAAAPPPSPETTRSARSRRRTLRRSIHEESAVVGT